MNLLYPPPEFKLQQDPDEFTHLLLLFHHYGPRRILEIGSAEGGTIWSWSHNCVPEAHITAVSLFDESGFTDPRPFVPQWEQEGKCTITTISGSSLEEATILEIKKHAPFDWIFIDGDHVEASVRIDYRTALETAMTNGLIVFHDIAFENTPYLEVLPVWKEVMATGNTIQIIHTPKQLGLGIVFAP